MAYDPLTGSYTLDQSLVDVGFNLAASRDTTNVVDPVAEAKAALDAAADSGSSQQYIDALRAYRQINNTAILGPKPPEKPGYTVQRVGDSWAYVSNTTGAYSSAISDGGTGITNSTDATNQLLLKQQADALAEDKRRQGQSAYDILFSEFTRYGLQSLVEPLKGLVTSGASSAEFSLALQNTDAYKKRFAANQQRINKGLVALSPAEYIALEDQYQNVMRNYGLPASYYTKDSMGTQQGFEKFLAADVSASELEDRIMTAQNRVINANPEVLRALKQFYPDITNGDILAYALDPEQGLSNIKRKVTAAEIGGAALAQGLQTGVSRAEELAGYGVTKDQAIQGFENVASVLPRGSQLASIYGEDPYTQATAEAEVFNTAGAAEAGAKRRKLTNLERASFAGSAGAAGGALSRDRATSQGVYRSSGAGNF